MKKWFFTVFVLFLPFVLTSQSESPVAADSRAPPVSPGVIPDALRRPLRGAAPVYPRDAVIGELGVGEAGNDPYRYARNALYDLVMKNKSSSFLKTLSDETLDELLVKLAEVAPRKYRVGAGMVEPDGSFSFLYRFFGRETEVTGSIYIMEDEDKKLYLDDIIMEDVTEIVKMEAWNYEYLPYERFY
ncbi:MAG: hypothetical protein LBC53_10190 [Spirochaetaceae bacterium]|jgi:hypothetical protein|nr:hypothetical protein [Spirochaetaceae bacterium]